MWHRKLCHCLRHLSFSRNERVSPKIPQIDSSSNVQKFFNSSAFYSFYHRPFFWIRSLQPFPNLERTFLSPLYLHHCQAFMHSFIHTCTHDTSILCWTYIPRKMGIQERLQSFVPLISVLNEFKCLWFPLKLKPLKALDFCHNLFFVLPEWLRDLPWKVPPLIKTHSRLILQI